MFKAQRTSPRLRHRVKSLKEGSFLLATLYCFYLQCIYRYEFCYLTDHFFFSLDVFKKGCWTEIDRNSRCKDLIPKLKLLSVASRAPSTVQCYLSGFQRWKKWCLEMNVSHFPADPVYVALYLLSIMETKESSRVVRNSLYSIDWAHKIAGLDVPSVHPMVSAVKESSSRLYGRPVVKKEVITSEMLSMLAYKYFDYHPSLYQARTVALCLTAFTGFLRYDELSNLLCLDVKFYPDYFLLFIESSKSDQYRDGAWVPISSSNLITCPLRALKRYADLGEIVFDSDCLYSEGSMVQMPKLN